MHVPTECELNLVCLVILVSLELGVSLLSLRGLCGDLMAVPSGRKSLFPCTQGFHNFSRTPCQTAVEQPCCAAVASQGCAGCQSFPAGPWKKTAHCSSVSFGQSLAGKYSFPSHCSVVLTSKSFSLSVTTEIKISVLLFPSLLWRRFQTYFGPLLFGFS